MQIIRRANALELISGQKGNSFDSGMRANDACFQAESGAAISRLPCYRREKVKSGKRQIPAMRQRLPKAPIFISEGTAVSPE